MDARKFLYPERRRGAIAHPDRARQLINFEGLNFGTITPTDLDGLIDYHNQQFAFLEIKSAGVPLLYGQQTAFERIVDRIEMSGARAALFFAHHTVRDCDQQIDAARTLVIAFYESRRWSSFPGIWTLRQALDGWFHF